MASKLDFDGVRLPVDGAEAVEVMTGILTGLGCDGRVADAIAEHLADASLCGVESHGVMRVLQYARQFRSGYMSAAGKARVTKRDGQFLTIDGGGGHGIPAMQLAFDTAIEAAVDTGMSVTAITNLGHTGRHGAFAELAAEAGMLSVLIGGGNRAVWRQVAPHGGAQAKLPTNPWCLGLPGGGNGPFILDFATSTVAGGWIYAAESAGAHLPEGCLIDADGNPSTDPKAYFE
ncbi:MAG: Ldh family oxidoreductase, partial [Candidatus Puniceispirillaceae bacterium]